MSSGTGDVGKYLKVLLFVGSVYTFVFIVVKGSGGATIVRPPPGANFLSLGKWLLMAVGDVIAGALRTMTFPFLPDPIRIPLTIFFGALLTYAIIGLIMSLVRVAKPW